MAYESDKIVTLESLKSAASKIKSEYLEAIAKTGHARFQKVESVPDSESAQENVLYLVMNDGTGHYDIYALVDGEIVQIDDTSVNLDGYVTEEDFDAAVASDEEVAEMLNEVFGEESGE